jgi:hypothetical protein
MVRMTVSQITHTKLIVKNKFILKFEINNINLSTMVAVVFYFYFFFVQNLGGLSPSSGLEISPTNLFFTSRITQNFVPKEVEL